MTCEECGEDKPVTYRMPAIGRRVVCGPCVRDNHPGTRISDSFGGSHPVVPENVSGPVHHVGDGDQLTTEEHT